MKRFGAYIAVGFCLEASVLMAHQIACEDSQSCTATASAEVALSVKTTPAQGNQGHIDIAGQSGCDAGMRGVGILPHDETQHV